LRHRGSHPLHGGVRGRFAAEFEQESTPDGDLDGLVPDDLPGGVVQEPVTAAVLKRRETIGFRDADVAGSAAKTAAIRSIDSPVPA
jgi:hypothetical protein